MDGLGSDASALPLGTIQFFLRALESIEALLQTSDDIQQLPQASDNVRQALGLTQYLQQVYQLLLTASFWLDVY
jgi:hypothetical protein